MGMFDGFGYNRPTALTDEEKASYDYKTAQADTLRRQAIMQALMTDSLRPTQGQMVPGGSGGIYVAPSPLTHLAKLAQLYVTNGSMKELDKDMKTHDENGNAARDYQFSRLNDKAQMSEQEILAAQAQREAELEAQGQAQLEMQRRLRQQQVPQTVTTSPEPAQPVPPEVRTTLADALKNKPAPQAAAPAPAPVAPPAAAMPPAAAVGAPTVADRARSPGFGLGAGTYTPKPNAGGGRGYVNPAPVDPTAPTPKMVAAQVLQGKKPVKSASTKPSQIIAPTQAKLVPSASNEVPLPSASEKQEILKQFDDTSELGYYNDGQVMGPQQPISKERDANQFEIMSRLNRIAQTSPEAAKEVEMIRSQMFGSKGEWKPQTIKTADGSEGLVLVNTITGQVKPAVDPVSGGDRVLETKETPDGLMERTSKGWRKAMDENGNPIRTKEGVKLEQDTVERNKTVESTMLTVNEANDRLTRVLSDVNIIKQAKGDVTNSVSGKLSQVTGVATDTSVARTKINDAVAAAVSAIIDMKRAGGMTASQMNSDADMRMIQRLAGEISDNYGALDEATLKGKLVQLQDMVTKVGAAQRPSGQAPAPATPAKGGGLLSGRF